MGMCRGALIMRLLIIYAAIYAYISTQLDISINSKSFRVSNMRRGMWRLEITLHRCFQ